MCNIIFLKPGYTLPFAMLQNMVWNNPHGYGLVLRDPEAKKLQLIKSKEKDLETGTDPKEVYDLLKKHEDVERYLHCRWKTEGDISQENVQPFCSYYTDERQVYFMHNGTLYDWKPETPKVIWQNGKRIETGDSDGNKSDTRKFNDDFLSPLLNRISGENGKGDILDPVFQRIVGKFWGVAQHNRGLLISNDLGAVYINPANWETIKDGENEFKSSNNTYFDKLTRGFEFDRLKKLEEEEKKARFQNTPSYNKNSAEVFKLKSILLEDKIKLLPNVADLLYDGDIYSYQGVDSLKNLTHLEWETFLAKAQEDDAIALLMHITDEFGKLYDAYKKASSYLDSINKKKVG